MTNLFPAGTLTVPGNLTIANGGSLVCIDGAGNSCPITVTVPGNMLIQAGGSINTNQANSGNADSIFITVCGDFTMDGPSGGNPGALITAQHTGSGTFDGGKITIVVGGVTLNTSVDPAIGVCCVPRGDILVSEGATIISNSNTHRAGDIALYAGRNITIKGLVSAEGTGGTGHGGAITIDACCQLLIDDTGVVTSRGLDPGPDRVHLEGCTVFIYGFVQSSGPAHTSAALLCSPPLRPSHVPPPGRFNSACVEVWSGTTLTVDSTGTHHGQINADVGWSGGTNGHGWVDLLANLDIHLNDGLGNNGPNPKLPPGDPPSTYLVHANMNSLTNSLGGDILAESLLGLVDFGNGDPGLSEALQANANVGGGSHGGTVTVQAGGPAVAPGNVNFHAALVQALGATSGGGTQGGGAIRGDSCNGQVTGNAPGSLDASGGPPLGSVKLFGGAGVTYTGGTTPPFVIDVVSCPLTFPTLPPPETYPSANCAQACQPATPTPTPTPTSTSTRTGTPTTFTPSPTPTVPCIKSEVIGALAGHVPDKVVRLDLNIETIQHAVDTVSDTNGDGFVIVLVVKDGTGQLGGHTNQRVTVSRNDYGHPFQLFGCSVTMHDPDIHDGLPTGWITAGAGGAHTIFEMDLHGADSEVAGWKVDGNGRTIRNTGGSGSPVGIWFNGNNNIMHNGAGSGNGIGLRIDGNGNVATDTDVFSNTSHGVQVIGNSNQLLKIDAGDIGKGNGGDGVNVTGTGNLIQEVDAYANTFNGISATGGNNTVKKNVGGDRGKGNGQKGFAIGGSGIVRENSAEGNGSFGFDITSGGHTLTSNTSGGTGAGEPNGGCQYNVAGSNTNGGGNKSNGVTVVGNPFPGGCTN